MSDNQSDVSVEEMPIKALRRKDISKVQIKKRQKQKRPQARELEISDRLKQLISERLDTATHITLKEAPTKLQTKQIVIKEKQSKKHNGIEIVFQPLPNRRPSSNFVDQIRRKFDHQRRHYSQLATIKK